MPRLDDKISQIVDYYMDNMLSEPEIIRDALIDYFNQAPNDDINEIFNDLLIGE